MKGRIPSRKLSTAGKGKVRMQKTTVFVLISLCICGVLLGACNKKEPDPKPTAEVSATSTIKPSITPSLTNTSTPAPTLTHTPTPTETMQWDEQGFSLTPIPSFKEVINADNASRVNQLAVWGNGKANTIALSPNGDILAVGTATGAFFYDSNYFSLIVHIPTPNPVLNIAFSNDFRFVALGQSHGRIDIIDQQNFTFLTRLIAVEPHFSNLRQVNVFLSRDSAFLTYLGQSNDQIFTDLWATASWQPAASFSTGTGIISFINPFVNIAGIIDGFQLSLQSLSYNEEFTQVPLPEPLPNPFWQDLAQSNGALYPFPDGNSVLINTGNTVLFWHLSGNFVKYVLDQFPAQLPDPCLTAANTCRNSQGGFSWVCDTQALLSTIGSINITPNSDLFLISRNDDRAQLHRASDGRKIWEVDVSFSEVAFYPNDEFFIGLRHDGTIEKRSLVTGGLFYTLNQHPSQVISVGFSPDNTILAAGYTDGFIRIYSSFNGELLGVLDGAANALSFSPDGTILAAGLRNGMVRIFNLNQGRFSDMPGGHLDEITGLAFTNDGTKLFSSSLDCTVSSWNVEGRHRHWNLSSNLTNPFKVLGLAQGIGDNAKFIFSQNMGIYQVNYPTISPFFSPVDTIFSDLTLSSNGLYLAAVGSPHSWLIPLSHANTIQNKFALQQKRGEEISVVAFSPDSLLMIGASSLGLEFWSTNKGVSVDEIPFSPSSSFNNTPVDLTVSPDGTLIGLSKSDGLLYIFGVNQTDQ